MSATPAAKPTAAELVRNKILPAVRLPAAIARHTLGKFRGLCLVGTVSALWQAHWLQTTFDLSLLWTGISFLVLAIPALILAWVWRLLADVAGLPERLEAFVQASNGLEQRLTGGMPESEAAGSAKKGGLVRIAGMLKDVWTISSEYSEVAAIVASTMSLSNPLVLIVTGIAGSGALLLAILALITALIAAF